MIIAIARLTIYGLVITDTKYRNNSDEDWDDEHEESEVLSDCWHTYSYKRGE